MEFLRIFLQDTERYLESVRRWMCIQKFKSGLARPIQKITLEAITFDTSYLGYDTKVAFSQISYKRIFE